MYVHTSIMPCICLNLVKRVRVGREFLATEAGQKHFKTSRDIFGDSSPDIWTPSVCQTPKSNCTVEIFHIASEGYDEGQVTHSERISALLHLRSKGNVC